MIDDTRGWLSLFLGIIAAAFGAIPLLFDFGVIGFNLPFSILGNILSALLILGAVFLFIDSAHEDHLQWVSIIIGIVLLVFGAVPLLAMFGVIPDFLSEILAVSIIRNIMLVVAGVFLMLGSGD